MRMVAILTVFASHLWDWPPGGFVGVDVFFVISGFLITGNLMRDAEETGTVNFLDFYWNRIRRIVPAATVVLALTFGAATLVFQQFRAHQVGLDALFAFAFMANWHFAAEGTDYFAQGAAVSPIQHYWSLSIEEQFYFVWPAIIFVISVVIVRRNWPHSRRTAIAGVAMGFIATASLLWAIYETATTPTAAYFSTFARVWELGVGAILSIAAGSLAHLPTALRPLLSWLGLAMIAASLFLIAEGSPAFPAPWAILPVAGAALVIVAGVGGEPRFQAFLRNPVSTYIGGISYSLYLVHWPVIVIAGAIMDVGIYYYVVVLALASGLAIASYHGVENPLRRIDTDKIRNAIKDIRRGRYQAHRSSQFAAAAAMSFLLVGLLTFMLQPAAPAVAPPDLAVADPADASVSGTYPADAKLAPFGTVLHDEIVSALKATEWPNFNPPAETVINGEIAVSDVKGCGAPNPTSNCTWGDQLARKKAVLIGDSRFRSYRLSRSFA
ncbi:acyltransferase [Mycobacterium hodleri]|nr:acyltransferase [Mycolicibacterium hodleri]